MMTIESFKAEIVDSIKDYLPEEYSDASVECNTQIKNNDRILVGLIVKKDNNISPVIYINSFYEEYKKGKDISDILREIAAIRIEHELPNKYDLKDITNYEAVKEKVFPRLINREWNRRRLEDKPYSEVADLAVTYNVLVDINVGMSSIPITYSLMNEWGITKEVLHEQAISNMPRLFPATVEPMSKILGSFFMDSDDDENVMSALGGQEMFYVLSNKEKINGAAVLLDKNLMDSIADRFPGARIIPSSIHEALLLTDDSMDVPLINGLIREVNEGEVAEEDRLSQNCYVYTKEQGLCIA